MEVKEVSITTINYRHLKPEDVFKWLEQFGFLRYGCNYNVDPSKRDDPRYPAERDQSPVGWYTHLGIPGQYYNRTMFIIDKEQFDTIKQAFHNSLLNASRNSSLSTPQEEKK